MSVMLCVKNKDFWIELIVSFFLWASVYLVDTSEALDFETKEKNIEA